MFRLFVFLLTLSPLTVAAADTPPDPIAELERGQLDRLEKEVRGDLGDAAWMAETARATVVRMQIERGWRKCAAHEAAKLARTSERASELLAETAAQSCARWRAMLAEALAKGADPYVEGYRSPHDLIALAHLQASRAALDRVLMWRAGSGAITANPAPTAAAPQPVELDTSPSSDRSAAEPAPSQETGAEVLPDEQVITIVARRGGCRVRLADRTLTKAELRAQAAAWAAAGTPLKVIRPYGADYRCLSKIVWQLGEHGLRFFQFIEPPQ